MIRYALPGKAALKTVGRGVFHCFAWSVIGFALTLAVYAQVFAADFSITPTSMELNGSVKSGAFSIINSGADAMNCQIDVKEWSQDAAGKDVYTEARDIVFFPKIMTVGPNEQRAVRIGMKGPPSLKEKAYRIFTEEIPAPKKAADEKPLKTISAGLTIAFRFSVPIFVRPVRPEESAVIEQADMSRSVAKAVVLNNGNVHIKLRSVTFQGKAGDGKELFSQEVAGWYILHSQSRRYEVSIPKEVCKKIAIINVTAESENMTIKGTLNVQQKMCGE